MTHGVVAQEAVWLAPAKINLFLHVVGRRDDGYHELQTAFQFLDVYDELRFTLTDDHEIQRRDSGLPLDLPDEDLCVRAARLLQSEAGIGQGVTIDLHKNLPAGGGLGGGSSDAATTLLALNDLWRLDLNRDELITLGVQLGADVPIFLFGESALAGGIGERLTPLSPPENWYAVLVPAVQVSTAEIFSDSSLTRTPVIKTIRGSLLPALHNDLEPVTCKRYPAVAVALDWLKSFGDARMSGSGASLFVAADSQQAAAEIVSQCSKEQGVLECEGIVTRGMNRHPHALP